MSNIQGQSHSSLLYYVVEADMAECMVDPKYYFKHLYMHT